MPNLVALRQTVWSSVGVPKFGGLWASRVYLTPRNMPRTGVSVANLVAPGQAARASVYRSPGKFPERWPPPLEMGLSVTPLTHFCYLPNLVAIGQTQTFAA